MTPGRSPYHRLGRVGLALLGTLAGFAWLSAKVDPRAVQDALADAHWGAWLLAVALVPVQTILAAERWHQASAILGVPLARRIAWSEFALSSAINQLLPGGIVGDGLRIWRQRDRQDGLRAATRAAVTDRWWGQTILGAAAVVALLLWPASVPQPLGMVAGVGCAVLGVLALWVLPVRLPVLGPVARDLRMSRRSWALPLLGAALFGAILGGFAACGVAVGLAPGTWLVCVVPVALLAASLPVSLGGWGLREGSVVALLPLFGVSSADALAVSLLFGVAFLVGTLPGLLVLTPMIGQQHT